VIALTILVIQGMHPTPRHRLAAGSDGDFRIVAYQGELILGGKDTTFETVFEQGKPVVLNFWAGNCPSCQVEMPGFQRVSSEFAGKVIVVGIDIGPFTGLGTHEDAVKLYRQLGIHYPLAYAVDASALQLYTVEGMPTTVFLTAKGQVVDRVTGILTEDQLRSEIKQKLLAAA
jgi:thiol-disulfide isomerase/thioredoxin